MKLLQLHVSIFALVFSIACGNSGSTDGLQIVSRDEMVEILADIQIFESIKQIRKDRSKEGFEIYKAYSWVFEQHNITEETFKKSLEYYAEDPVELEKIYDEVIIRISEKQAELTAS